MNTTTSPLTEADVRKLRDEVFGQTSTDKNWDGCKGLWMQPSEIAWLQSQPKAKRS